MKKTSLNFLLLCFVSDFFGQAPKLISPTEYASLMKFNAFYVCPAYDSQTYKINKTQEGSIISTMKSAFAGCDNYPIGLCETRAHYLSLKAAVSGIRTFKVWIFASNVISIFGDGLSLKGKAAGLTWNYHVATAAVDANDNVVVFDPVVNVNSSISLATWLASFNAEGSIYFYTCPGYYLHNSEFLSNVSRSVNLFNGKFWQLTPITNGEPIPNNQNNVRDWKSFLVVRLAANDVASQNINSSTSGFQTLVKNFNDFQKWFVDETDTRFATERTQLKAAQKKYEAHLKDIDPANYREFFYIPN